ncbi:antitoxin [Streptomyces sp. LX-29]|uniref:antitoxin n=1 Tax=Streptomyces sp. LX-29 TaxID=2900152 RepID=UPI00240D9325|nr:antitoxin [Streptomyces sp. LX-29]WFB07058.1 antitoxin [Streptomyces sp. LX-29]
MGLLNTLKAKAGVMKGKAGDFMQQHEPQIERGLDKAAKAVDSKTKGKYSGKIETGTDKAKGALGRLSHKDTGTGEDAGAGPGTGAPTSGT